MTNLGMWSARHLRDGIPPPVVAEVHVRPLSPKLHAPPCIRGCSTQGRSSLCHAGRLAGAVGNVVGQGAPGGGGEGGPSWLDRFVQRGGRRAKGKGQVGVLLKRARGR